MKAPLSLLLAATILAAPAVAQDMADSVVDKSTKRAYPVHLQAGETDQIHTLTGIGVRTRTMLNVKVYAVGLYIDAMAAQVGMADWAGKTPKELEKDKEVFRRMLEMDMDHVVVTVDRHGNTSAASVPLALDEAVRGSKIKPGDIVLMTAFGAGLTWAASVVRW